MRFGLSLALTEVLKPGEAIEVPTSDARLQEDDTPRLLEDDTPRLLEAA